MKWFQVDSDTPNDPKIKRLIQDGLLTGGPDKAAASMGHLFLLWCYVAGYGESEPGLAVRADGTSLPHEEMAHEALFPNEDGLFEFLGVLADRGLIHPNLWRQRRTVLLPAMWGRACEYYQQKQRPISRHSTADELVAAILAGEAPIRPKPAAITEAQRLRIYKRDGLICRYCRLDLNGLPKQRCIDHVIPFIQDGLNEDDNLATSCKPCNARKGGRTPEQAGMALHPVDGGITGGEPPANITINNQQSTITEDQNFRGSGDPPDLLADAGETGPDALVRVWNDTRIPGPAVGKLSPQRRAAFGRALKATPDLTEWRAVIVWLNGQRWCNGQGGGDHPNWRATLDWLAKPGKLAEYLDKARGDRPASPDGTVGRNAAKGRTGYRPGQFADALKTDDAIH